jgi:TonB-dependent SusC/RagA subfamily outer membrane receptor
MLALGCVLFVAALAGCRPLTPRPEGLAPDERRAGDRRTRTASDASMERDVRQPTYSRIEELIEGRAPGVQVLRMTNGTFALRIRGVSSPAGNNDPLIVVDGARLEGPASSALGGLNPQDVLRIEVLKDAASTAFYGMRGANGVILITSRKE